MQCQAGVFREDRVAHTTFDKLGRDTLVLKPLSPTVVVQTSPVGLSDLAEHFQLYRQIVEEYTTKSLSYEADILHAARIPTLLVIELNSQVPQCERIVARADKHDTVVRGVPFHGGDLLLVEREVCYRRRFRLGRE